LSVHTLSRRDRMAHPAPILLSSLNRGTTLPVPILRTPRLPSKHSSSSIGRPTTGNRPNSNEYISAYCYPHDTRWRPSHSPHMHTRAGETVPSQSYIFL
jgi:hypothetical protein